MKQLIRISKVAENPSNVNNIVSILNSALDSADPFDLSGKSIDIRGKKLEIRDVYGKLSSFDLSKFNKIILIGIGKACAPIAKHLELILTNKISTGLLIVKYGYKTNLKCIEIKEAGHPIPDNNGLHATNIVTNLLKNASKDTLILFIVTGGGSSLFVSPENGIDFNDLQTFSNILLKSGLSIQEMNILRTSVSKIKGGRLSEIAYPATVVSLIVSDVPGNNLESIASGPTISTNIEYSDCINLLKYKKIYEIIPSSIKNFYLNNKNKIRKTRTLNSYNILLGSNRICLENAGNAAVKLGYFTHILTDSLSGPIEHCVDKFTDILKQSQRYHKPFCILSGGETEVAVKKGGKGGRNQHFALLFARETYNIDINNKITFASLGTDGGDGKCDVAGAVIDREKLKKTVEKKEIEKYLERFDSYGFFKKYGGHIITGPTNTNFMDIQALLID
ncbi:DUF4147 domain-containing protein [bacterium]|nr:DUF4147 domain-containing protein [bacterium]